MNRKKGYENNNSRIVGNNHHVKKMASDRRIFSDKIRQTYRTILECIASLDKLYNCKNALPVVFTSEAVHLRMKLAENCEKLMFYKPVDYSRRAEDILWKKVYYATIQIVKTNRKLALDLELVDNAYHNHLTSAVGFYQHLLNKIQQEAHLRLYHIIDLPFLAEPRLHRKHNQHKQDVPPAKKQWALDACHRILVAIGDISRYQYNSAIESFHPHVAQRYYHQAICVNPKFGMPFNQLGTLAGCRCYDLDASYHYMMSLACAVPFHGARDNLRRIFARNSRRHADMLKPRGTSGGEQPTGVNCKDLKGFVVRFLHVMSIMLDSSQSLISGRELKELCELSLLSLDKTLLASKTARDDSRTGAIDDDLAFKVIIMCLIACHQLQRDSSKMVTAAIAYSLALILRIINHTIIRLHTNFKRRHRLIGEGGAIQQLSSEETLASSDSTLEENSSPVSPSKSQRRPRRRQRAHFNIHDSDLSEGEEAHSDSSASSSDKSLDYSDEEGHQLVVPPELTMADDEQQAEHEELPPEPGPETWGRMTEESTAPAEPESSKLNFDPAATFPLPSAGAASPPHQSFGGPNIEEEFLSCAGSNDDLDANQRLTGLNSSFSVMAGGGLAHSFSSIMFNDGLPDEMDGYLNQFASNAELKAIVDGSLHIRAPPGFESESKHVEELSDKLRNFEIETDTDVTLFTDTDNSSNFTGSETENQDEPGDSQRTLLLIENVKDVKLLQVLKVYCDWLRSHSHVIATCATNHDTLWSHLAILLNFLPSEDDLLESGLCGHIEEEVHQAAELSWTPQIPLPEDRQLMAFTPLEDIHRHLVFSRTFQRLDDTQAAILRICSLRKFGYMMARMGCANFAFSEDRKVFVGPLQISRCTNKSHECDSSPAPEDKSKVDQSRQALMSRMAGLWLQHEVSKLEAVSSPVSIMPVLLCPDTMTLLIHFSEIKRLSLTAKFVIVIASVVVTQLDLAKTSNFMARDVIRWLQKVPHSDNKQIHVQQLHEHKSENLPRRNLKHKDPSSWQLAKLIDCVEYYIERAAESKEKSSIDHSAACLLLNASEYLKDEKTGDNSRNSAMLDTANKSGMQVMTLVEFLKQWKL